VVASVKVGTQEELQDRCANARISLIGLLGSSRQRLINGDEDWR